jgi:quercetin dioxygenase-like cupin family protein
MNDIEKLEGIMLNLEQVETPLTHRFAPGVYLREIFMPEGAMVIGHQHKTKHFNIVISGSAYVAMDGEIVLVQAGDTFTSEPGVRKALLILEDMRWQTVHPISENASDWTPEQQLALVEVLEDELIIRSETWQKHHAELESDFRELLEVAQ